MIRISELSVGDLLCFSHRTGKTWFLVLEIAPEINGGTLESPWYVRQVNRFNLRTATNDHFFMDWLDDGWTYHKLDIDSVAGIVHNS